MSHVDEILKLLRDQAAERHQRQTITFPMLVTFTSSALRQQIEGAARDADAILNAVGTPMRTAPTAQHAAHAAECAITFVADRALQASGARARLLDRVYRTCAG